MPPQRVAGIVMVGAGAAALIGGGALGGLAIARKNQSDAAGGGCDATTDVCSTAGMALRKDALGVATASTVLVIAGAAIAGTGVVLAVTARPRAPRLAVGPAGASLSWRW
jgi:hypothetical protein